VIVTIRVAISWKACVAKTSVCFDNGIEQPLTSFATIEEPAQVLLLIEAGPAVYLLESSHVWASYSLLSACPLVIASRW